MLLDEEGFEYPVVDAAACIGCGKCMAICPFKKKLNK
jgi:Fe-S-cluster-containing hydrogenase component 2